MLLYFMDGIIFNNTVDYFLTYVSNLAQWLINLSCPGQELIWPNIEVL